MVSDHRGGSPRPRAIRVRASEGQAVQLAAPGKTALGPESQGRGTRAALRPEGSEEQPRKARAWEGGQCFGTWAPGNEPSERDGGEGDVHPSLVFNAVDAEGCRVWESSVRSVHPCPTVVRREGSGTRHPRLREERRALLPGCCGCPRSALGAQR